MKSLGPIPVATGRQKRTQRGRTIVDITGASAPPARNLKPTSLLWVHHHCEAGSRFSRRPWPMILGFHIYRPRQTTRTPWPLFNSQPQEFWGSWAPHGPSDPVKAYGPTASTTGMHHTLDQAPGQMLGRTSTAGAAGLKAFSSPHATPHNANPTGPGAAPLGHFCLPDKSAACYPTPSNAKGPTQGPIRNSGPAEL